MDPCMMKMVAIGVGGFVAGLVAAKVFCPCGKKAQGEKAQGAARGGGDAPARSKSANTAPVRQPIPAGSVEIYVGNLSYDMSEDDLRKTFGEFGTVDSVRVVTNRFNNKSKGFGFVVMPNRPEAEKAIAALDEKEVMGRRMKVNEAQNSNRM